MHEIPSDRILANIRSVPFQPPSLPSREYVSSSLTDADIKAEYCARAEAAGFLKIFSMGAPHLRDLYVRKPIQGTSDYTAVEITTDDVVGGRNADEAAQEQPMAMSKSLYHVGKDAYVVIKALFHVPNDSEPPGKIRWDQLVATLTKLGFAVEKLHGSA
ncbi:hypothetical protein J4E91_010349 [Alternaria rosae]|nr:hypothetical protein J4E91_010349 [Alternaria rosae]